MRTCLVGRVLANPEQFAGMDFRRPCSRPAHNIVHLPDCPTIHYCCGNPHFELLNGGGAFGNTQRRHGVP